MKFIYRLFWTMSIMSWMLFLYMLKNIQSTGFEIACILVGFFVVVSPLIAIFFAKHLSHDCINGCSEIQCVDRKCVVVICWISLIACITDTSMLFWMNFAAFSVLLYRTEMMYFHPMLILFGFHFYEVKMDEGTCIRIIKRGKIVRNAKYMVSDNLYRLSDYTYIEL